MSDLDRKIYSINEVEKIVRKARNDAIQECKIIVLKQDIENSCKHCGCLDYIAMQFQQMKENK